MLALDYWLKQIEKPIKTKRLTPESAIKLIKKKLKSFCKMPRRNRYQFIKSIRELEKIQYKRNICKKPETK